MKAFLLLVMAFGFFGTFGQLATPILERKISIECVGVSLPTALDRIGKLGGFSFSYNSRTISTSQIVNLKVSEKTIKTILDQLFKGSMIYREKTNHLILTLTPEQSSVNRTTVIIISGYVEDEKSGEKISDVSLFEKKSLASSVTDDHGFYKIKLDNPLGKIELSIRKKNYKDTALIISASGNSTLNFSIRPVAQDRIVVTSQVESVDTTKQTVSLAQEKKEKFRLPYESEANVQNIHDTLYHQFQVSFLPFFGTNGRLSGNVINNYSFNILGGYSLGVRNVEVSGFVNIDRGDVSWLQLAGFGNLVGQNVYGVQASGFFNLNRGATNAWQMTGFMNLNFGETRGVQLAGFTNTNFNSTRAIQIAGFHNSSKGPSEGAQIAGFSNVQRGEYHGPQIAGFINVNTKGINGLQLAGFANIAKGKVEGSQLSGFFNYAKKVKGVQLGLINISDSLGGVPLGLINYVKHGYHKLEVSADEVFYTNLAFRTGVKNFYTILFAGIKPDPAPDNVNVWTSGYGLGTERRITERLRANIDITSQHISKGSFTHATNLLNKIHVGLDFSIRNKISIYAGATLNGYLTEKSFTDYPVLFSNQTPSIFYDHTVGSDRNLKVWLGWKVGLRFF